MLYESFVDQIRHFDFIPDAQTADSALKAALGLLVSVMDDDRARRLTQELPGPLDYATLRGNQIGAVRIPLADAVTSLAVQFDLAAGQAQELLKRAFHCVKTSVDHDLVAQLFAELPEDWKGLIADA